MKIIAVEEHFMSKAVNDRYKELFQGKTDLEKARNQFVDVFVNKGEITELGDHRIAFMDRCGIDVQMIGYGNNSPMHARKEDGAVELCKIANDELYAATKEYPGRFYGYAILPVDDVEASVKELERCVKELGFKGWIVNGPFEKEFMDGARFFPIFEKAAELGVPVYFHPHEVANEVVDHYYMGDWSLGVSNIFSGFGIGWHYDTAMHLMRVILAGTLDKLPNLKLIVGHWGEMLPYYFDRMNAAMNPNVTGLKHELKYYFYNNVYTDPSGIFSKDDFEFCLKVMNPEHIMWAQDYPYGINDEEVRTFLEQFEVDDEMREMVAHKNAEKLFGI